jgi:aerobic carbon-monoxide dehydrogenase medium subunit
MKPAEFSYERPASLADAIGNLASYADQGRIIAGGQSLGPMLNFRLAQPKHLVDISRLDHLRHAQVEGDVLAIGACVTHAEIEDGKIPDVTGGLMGFVAHQIAYRAVRNRGTIGGSLAHADPAADWLTTTIALDAILRLQGNGGKRQVKVAEFVKGALETTIRDDEVITHVLIPRLSAGARWGHAKYAKKLGDFAQSMAVAVVDFERKCARVVLGRRDQPPALMRGVSDLLATQGCEPAAESLRTAVEADLKEAAVEAGDYLMHRAIVERAARDLMA